MKAVPIRFDSLFFGITKDLSCLQFLFKKLLAISNYRDDPTHSCIDGIRVLPLNTKSKAIAFVQDAKYDFFLIINRHLKILPSLILSLFTYVYFMKRLALQEVINTSLIWTLTTDLFTCSVH